MNKLYDVIIAGAGLVGLFLACELALACNSVLVIERDLNPDRRGLNTSSMEALYRRGLLSKFLDPGERAETLIKTPGFQFGGTFAGITLNANKLELDRWSYRLPGPALVPGPTTLDRIESVLTQRAESLGVKFLRGSGVAKILEQEDDSITVETGEHQCFRGKWLVGCDGGRSAIRKAAGFDFTGTEAKFTGYAVSCDFDNQEQLKLGFHVTRTGMYIVAPNSLYLVDFDNTAFDRSQEITEEHIQDVLQRVSGIMDVNITKVHIASSFTDRAKQATTYRKGRVLVAGDAAHINGPLGSQGMNTGLGDAMNLGWKLAATINHEVRSDGPLPDLTPLDTYESERHPIGAWVLEWTRAQVAIIQPGPYSAALQAVIRELIHTTDGTNVSLDRLWGLSQRYNLGNEKSYEHPLVGSSVPDFEFHDGSRLGPKLETGRGLFVDFEGDTALKELIGLRNYRNKVDYVGMTGKNQCGLRALLVRPDGIVTWVVEQNEKPDIEMAKTALRQWFGL